MSCITGKYCLNKLEGIVMSKVCDKVLLVEANNLSNEQVESFLGIFRRFLR